MGEYTRPAPRLPAWLNITPGITKFSISHEPAAVDKDVTNRKIQFSTLPADSQETESLIRAVNLHDRVHETRASLHKHLTAVVPNNKPSPQDCAASSVVDAINTNTVSTEADDDVEKDGYYANNTDAHGETTITLQQSNDDDDDNVTVEPLSASSQLRDDTLSSDNDDRPLSSNERQGHGSNNEMQSALISLRNRFQELLRLQYEGFSKQMDTAFLEVLQSLSNAAPDNNAIYSSTTKGDGSPSLTEEEEAVVQAGEYSLPVEASSFIAETEEDDVNHHHQGSMSHISNTEEASGSLLYYYHCQDRDTDVVANSRRQMSPPRVQEDVNESMTYKSIHGEEQQSYKQLPAAVVEEEEEGNMSTGFTHLYDEEEEECIEQAQKQPAATSGFQFPSAFDDNQKPNNKPSSSGADNEKQQVVGFGSPIKIVPTTTTSNVVASSYVTAHESDDSTAQTSSVEQKGQQQCDDNQQQGNIKQQGGGRQPTALDFDAITVTSASLLQEREEENRVDNMKTTPQECTDDDVHLTSLSSMASTPKLLIRTTKTHHHYDASETNFDGYGTSISSLPSMLRTTNKSLYENRGQPSESGQTFYTAHTMTSTEQASSSRNIHAQQQQFGYYQGSTGQQHTQRSDVWATPQSRLMAPEQQQQEGNTRTTKMNDMDSVLASIHRLADQIRTGKKKTGSKRAMS